MRRFRIAISVLMLAVLLLVGTVPITLASPPAQGGIRTVTHDQTGKLTFIGIDTASGASLPKATGNLPSRSAALNDLAAYSQEFGITDPARDLQFMKSATTRSGSTSYRYQQVYQGVPVLAGELIATYDARGHLASIAGEISPDLTLDVKPQVSTTTAKERALSYVARQGFDLTNLTATEPELWIYDARLLQPSHLAPVLVWRLEVKSVDLQPIDYVVLVDAKLGGVRLAFNQIDTYIGQVAAERLAHDTLAPVADPGMLAAPNYPNPSGTTWDSHSTSSRGGTGSSTVVCNTAPTALTDAGSCDGTAAPASTANAAHYFAYNTFNYYDSHHNRNSINDAGHPLNSNVNFRPGSTPYMNAFWDGSVMTYGDGDFFTADDVVAHELSHGVTQYGSNLLYFNESGAINEAMSDIFGEFLDQSNGVNSYNTGADAPADKWLMGEDLGIGAIRDMADPPAFGDPDRTRSGIYWTSGLDNGGVHINSGVVNKTAYLMAEGGTFNSQTITALGNDKTSAIFYEVNNTLLTSGADFQHLDAAISQACSNILAGSNPLGFTAADCTEADQATMATELHLEPVNDNWTPQADLCPTPGDTPTTTLFSNDFESDTGNTLTGFEDGVISGAAGMPSTSAWQEATLSDFSNIFPPVTGNRTAFGVNHPYLYGFNPTAPYESYLQMSSYVALPAASSYYLHFDHYFAFEVWQDQAANVWEPDGGVLEYQVQGSGTWTDAGSLFDAGQNYNGVVDSHDGSSPLEGDTAFIVNSHGYVSTRYDLSSLAGQNIRFRWRIGADSYGDLGWYLDNVQIYTCATATEADLSIEKSDDADPVNQDDTVTYTITVDNLGPDDAENVTVSDTFTGAAVTVTSVTPSQGSCTTFPCNLGAIANSGTATITVQVTADVAGTITNTASVSSDTTDPVAGNNSSVEQTTVNGPKADLGITKTDDADPVNNGKTVIYTITVTNNGPDAATNVTVTDTFSGAAVNLVSVTPSQGTCTGFPCNLGTIADSGSATIEVEVVATDDGTITNHAEVAGDEGDDVPGNNVVDETTVVNPVGDLAIEKTDSADPVSIGETFTYTIGITNFGPDDAHNIVVDDVFSGAAVTVNQVWASHSDCTTFPCTIDVIQAGLGGNIWVEVTANAAGTITNSVEISADEVDVNLANNTFVETTTVVDAPVLIAPANGSLTNNNLPTFEWSAVPWGAYYEIEIDDSADFGSVEQTTTTPDLFYEPEILLDDTTYFWRVRGYDISDVARDWSPVWSVDIDTLRLAPPTLRQPKDRGTTADTTPRFTWTSVRGAANYWLQVSNDEDFNDWNLMVNDQTLTKSSFTVPTALSYDVYYWRAAAKDANGNWSDWSSIYAFTLTIQTSPKNGDYSVQNPPTFKWKTVAGATHYQFQLEDVPGPLVFLQTVPLEIESAFEAIIIDDDTLTTTKFTPAGALAEGRYNWRVRAEVGGVWTEWMPAWTLTVTAAPPSAPVLTTPANTLVTADDTQIFGWDAVLDAGGPFFYQIQIDNNANFNSPEQDYKTDAGVTTYDADSLADGKYFWRVRALNSVGVAGKWSKRWSLTVDTTGPAAPNLVAPENYVATGNQPELSWTKVKGAATYHLRISENPNLNPEVLDVPGITGTIHTPAAPLPDDTYYWAVRSVDALGNEGPWSDTWTFAANSALNPPDTPLLTSPTDGTVITTQHADLEWGVTTGAAQYQVQVDDKVDFKTPVEDEFDPNEAYQTHNLDDGTYYWRVRAINADNVAGNWTSPWSFTVDTTGPAAPKLKAPKPNAVTTDRTPTFQWSVPATAVLYHLQVATDWNYTTLLIDENTLTAPIYTVADIDALPYNFIFWQVRAQDANGNWGPWSDWNRGYFEITLHKAPRLGTITSSTQPTFKWNSAVGATSYCLQIDTDEFVDPILVNETGLTALSYKPVAPLAPGDYVWRVGIDSGTGCDTWMTAWTLHVKAETPDKVKLVSPKNRFLTNDNTPTLMWTPVTGAAWYDVQIGHDKKFATTFDYQQLDANLGTSYTIPGMPDDEFFWRVRAINSANTYGPWSAVWSFTVDTTPPDAPELVGPAEETRMTNRKFKLEWSKVSDAARYELQIDTDPSFPIPPIDVGKKTKYKAPSWLSQSTYYWRVRAIDKAGNASEWSDTRIFHLVAGDTAAPVITIEPADPGDGIIITPDRPVPSDEPAGEQPPVNSNDPVPPQEPDTKVPSPADPPRRSTP